MSGNVSHKVALAFKEWLPLVIQSVDPYVSSEDIQKGARWSADVEKALAESRFGIICLTEDNLTAPWINFEAGALSKAIENAQVNVCPFLFNIKQSSVEGPLSQFQSVRNEKEEIGRLVSTINAAAKVEHERVKPQILEQSFNAFWPKLEKKFREIAEGSAPIPAPARKPDEILENILEIVRSQSRLSASRQDVIEVGEWLIKRLETLEQSRGYLATINSQLIGTELGETTMRLFGSSRSALPSRVFGETEIQIDNPVIPLSESEPSEPDAAKSDAEETPKKK